MEKRILRVLLLALCLVFLFFLVYSPHLQSKFPLHIDEWHHISEATSLKAGDTPAGHSSLSVGFQYLLVFLSLFTNLVISYHLFPAIWAVVSALVLYFVVYKKTDNFYIALLSVLFFASIKSNVNILGLWFFTPLTFAIPFIFLFVYFFTEGIEKQNKRFIITSLVFMILLIPIHVISFSFAIPFLLIYSYFHRKYLLKEWKFFSSFLVIPILALIFYLGIMKISFGSAFSSLIKAISFERGWGVLEVDNSFLEIYSLIGYVFALIGAWFLVKTKKHLAYVLWPAMVLISIFIFRLTGVSYFAPYQRNLYYLAISLPFLSAFGFYEILRRLKESLIKSKKEGFSKIILPVLILISIICIFTPYYNIPPAFAPYESITEESYAALNYLSSQPRGVVMADVFTSLGIYPISGQKPFATVYFYQKARRDDQASFYLNSCSEMKSFIKEKNIRYVFSREVLDCGWKIIYETKNAKIYGVRKND